MKKIKNIFALSSFAIAAFAITSCGPNHNIIEDEEDYNFINNKTPVGEYDDLLKIDGVLDDDIYKEVQWFEDAYITLSDEIPVRMTILPSTTGIFFAFEVDDKDAHVSSERVSFYNSGIELYLSAGNNKTFDGSAWEIDFNPNNNIRTAIQLDGTFQDIASGYETAPIIASTTKGGPLNSEECEGYVMESFISWKHLGMDENIPSYLLAHPALIVKKDDTPEGRVWHSFGEHNLPGWQWHVPDSWWKFTATGWDAFPVTIKNTGNGQVTCDKSSIYRGATGTFYVLPEEGYRLKSLKYNGKDYSDKVSYFGNIPTVTIERVFQSIDIEAEFEEIPTTTVDIKGKIQLGNEDLTPEQIAELDAYALSGGVYYELEEENGQFKGTIPSGDFIIEIVSKVDEYVAHNEYIKDPATGKELLVKIHPDNYGVYRKMKLNDFTSKGVNGYSQPFNGDSGGFRRITDSIAFKMNISTNAISFDENGEVVLDPALGGKEPRCLAEFQCHFYPPAEKADNNKWAGQAFLEFGHLSEDWIIKIGDIDRKTNDGYVLTKEDLMKLTSSGMDLIFLLSAERGVVYEDLGDGTYKKLDERAIGIQKGMRVNYVDFWIRQGVEGVDWSGTNVELLLNKSEADFPLA